MKRHSFKRREALTGIAFALPALIGFGVFFAVPFAMSVFMSFTNGLNSFIGFNHYLSLFESAAFWLAAKNTFRFIAVGVPLLTAVSLLLALLLTSALCGVSAFRTIFVLPLVLPVASVITVFNILFEASGILNKAIVFFGGESVNFLHSKNAFWVLIILYIWKNCGYTIILFMAGLSRIPPEYHEAAALDGAGGLRRFYAITLPLLSRTFFIVIIMDIVNLFKAFREAFALGGNYPDDSIYMLQHFMNNNYFTFNYARLSSASMLIFSVIFMLVLVMFVFSERAGGDLT